jgi:SnoaL-like domain
LSTGTWTSPQVSRLFSRSSESSWLVARLGRVTTTTARVRYCESMKIVPLSFPLLAAGRLAALSLLCLPLVAQTMPPLKRQPTPAKVVEEHMAAFSSCDWPRLMAQFPENVEFFGPNGQVVRGKTALGQMFAQVVKPPSQGGTCGLKVVAEHTFVVGDTINVQWRADSPLLKEPYRGADAYETHDGLMAAQVTTWNPAALKWKVPPTASH